MHTLPVENARDGARRLPMARAAENILSWLLCQTSGQIRGSQWPDFLFRQEYRIRWEDLFLFFSIYKRSLF